MQIREFPVITYQKLARKFKDITVSSYHSPNGISVLHVMPKNGSRVEPDIFTFEKDVLITSDVALKTKDGGAKQVFTNFFTNGMNTIIREVNPNLRKEVETVIDRTIIPLSHIRKSRKGGGVAALKDKMLGHKVDETIPVTITKKTVSVNEMPPTTQFNIIAIGQKDSVQMISDSESTHLIAKGRWGEARYNLDEFKNPQKKSNLNKIFDWFIKENKGMQ